MSYCTTNELKTYLSISSDTDDELLSSAILAATQQIREYTGRDFFATVETTKYIQSTRHNISPDGRVLYLDIERLELAAPPTEVIVSGTDVTAFIKYYGLPPYENLVLSKSSGYRFDMMSNDIDEYESIKITGLFGYSTEVPSDIKQATLVWAAHLYQLKDTYPDDKVHITDKISEQFTTYPTTAISLIEAYRKKF